MKSMFRLVSFAKKYDASDPDGLHYTPVINGEEVKILVQSFGAGIVEMADGTRLFVSLNDLTSDEVVPIHPTDEELDKMSRNEETKFDWLWSF